MNFVDSPPKQRTSIIFCPCDGVQQHLEESVRIAQSPVREWRLPQLVDLLYSILLRQCFRLLSLDAEAAGRWH